MAKSVLKDLNNVEVCDYSGLTVDFAMANDVTVIVRGLRAVSDFEYELQLANMNRYLAKEIETAFLTPTEYAFITSSLVREVANMGGNVSSFVAPVVERILVDRFNKSKN
jgi:pantetheine-phosphate adenylyltransferase